MPIFEFDTEKSHWLKANRGVSFEDIIALMDAEHILDVVEHSNKEKYGHQSIFVMHIVGYVYLVPFVKTGKKYFLKTIIPSRKATAQYKKEDADV